MREAFEQWYLQVVKGHPNNLLKDESGGYRYLGVMYLAWEASSVVEREACANVLNLSRSEALLMAGEMTAQEWRTVAAVLRALQARMRSNAELTGAGQAQLDRRPG